MLPCRGILICSWASMVLHVPSHTWWEDLYDSRRLVQGLEEDAGGAVKVWREWLWECTVAPETVAQGLCGKQTPSFSSAYLWEVDVSCPLAEGPCPVPSCSTLDLRHTGGMRWSQPQALQPTGSWLNSSLAHLLLSAPRGSMRLWNDWPLQKQF